MAGTEGVRNKNSNMDIRDDYVKQKALDSEVLLKQLQHALSLVESSKVEIRQLHSRVPKKQGTKEVRSNDHGAENEIAGLRHNVEELRQVRTEEYDALFNELQQAKAQIVGFESLRKSKEQELLQKHQEEIAAYKEVNMKIEELLQAEKSDKEKWQSKLKDAAKRKIVDLDQERANLSVALENLKVEKEKVEKELSDTKSRLSKLMGDRVSDNNPDIADLSDKNRPTKIAEKYTELYDNQWTDAYEATEEYFADMKEKSRVRLLNKLLMDINKFCKEEFSAQDKLLMQALYIKEVEGKSSIPEGFKKQIKDIKRQNAPNGIDNITEKFLDNVDKTTKLGTFTGKVNYFVHECVSLCWLMVHQDPPLALDLGLESGDQFDNNRYKAYTTTGTTIDFVVWPPLLLHQKGPVLAKGVAQCLKNLQGSTSTGVRSSQVSEAGMGKLTGSVRLPGQGTNIWLLGARDGDQQTCTQESQQNASQMFEKTKSTYNFDQKTNAIDNAIDKGNQNDYSQSCRQHNSTASDHEHGEAGVNQRQGHAERSLQNRNNCTGARLPQNQHIGQQTQQFRNDAHTQLSHQNNAAGIIPQQLKKFEQPTPSSNNSNNQRNEYVIGNSHPYASQISVHAQGGDNKQNQAVPFQQQFSTGNQCQTPIHTNSFYPYERPTQSELNAYLYNIQRFPVNAVFQYMGAAQFYKCKNYNDWLFPKQYT